MAEPVYKKISDKKFTSRGPFVRAIADLVHEIYAERLALTGRGAVTIRGVYYQAVMRGMVESGPGYVEVQQAISDGRETGLVPWNYIVDQGRKVQRPVTHGGLLDELERLYRTYARDANAGQRFRIEVWLEQAALEGVVWPVCEELGVPLMVCGGFVSHGALWNGAERQRHYAGNLGQHGIVLVLSDLDPSGVAMAGYIERKLTALSDQDIYVQRIGLTQAQADTHELRGRPLKIGREDKADDSRAASFLEHHGELAYELDGLPAAALQEIVRDAITPMIDGRLRGESLADTAAAKARLRELIQLGAQEELFDECR